MKQKNKYTVKINFSFQCSMCAGIDQKGINIYK